MQRPWKKTDILELILLYNIAKLVLLSNIKAIKFFAVRYIDTDSFHDKSSYMKKIKLYYIVSYIILRNTDKNVSITNTNEMKFPLHWVLLLSMYIIQQLSHIMVFDQ